MTRQLRRALATVPLAGLVAACLGSAPAVAVPPSCAEDLTSVLGEGRTRALGGGVDLTVWQGRRSGAGQTSSSPDLTSVRAAVVHADPGASNLAPLLAFPAREDPAAVLEDSGRVAAVNADLFSPVAVDAAVPRGPVVQGGQVRFAPPGRHRVVHWEEGRPHLHRARLRASIAIATPQGSVRIPIAGVNFPSLQEGAVLFDRPWSGRTTRGRTTLVVRDGRVRDVIRGGRAVEPTRGEYVIQVPDASLVPVGVVAGQRADVRAALGRTRGDANALGHGGRLLRNGSVTRDCDVLGSLLRPRTALGWNPAGDVWLAVVSNGRPDPKDGMRVGGVSVTALGGWLASLGATDAVLFDGGGSTIMLRRGQEGSVRVDLPPSAYRRPVPVLVALGPSRIDRMEAAGR